MVIERISDSLVLKRQRGQLKKFKNIPQEKKKVLPETVLRIREQENFNITKSLIDALKDEVLDFNDFVGVRTKIKN